MTIRKRSSRVPAWLLGGGLLCWAGAIQAASVMVTATDVIYASGSQFGDIAGTGGTVPGVIIPLGPNISGVTFSSVNGSAPCASNEGCIMLDDGTGNVLNDADGDYGAASSSSVSGPVGSISGITAPGDGYLVGVFLAPGGPFGAAPPALNFTGAGGTSFTTLSPSLDQVFFIGDGLTGDGSGSEQVFNTPAGANELVLGISDACGYNGSGPSCYGDNVGSYTADYSLIDPPPANPLSTVPEPSTVFVAALALLPMIPLHRRDKTGTRTGARTCTRKG
jgi:hypothetical protein